MGSRIIVFKRQSIQLVVNITTQVKHRLLSNACHQILLEVAKYGAQNIKTQQNQNNMPNILKIDGCPGNSLRFCDDPLKELGCCLPHHLWTKDTEHSTHNGHKKYR
ncbi:hypothetical protein D3C76_1406850 [compost metagenome]